MTAGDTAAEDDHVRRRHARNAAQQHAAPAFLLLQAARADMRRHAAGHLGHRGEQRQRALRAGHGLVGDRGHARRHQVLGLLAVGREMQVGEQNLAGVELFALDSKRLLDLDDQFGARVDRIRIGRDLGAGRLVVGIGKTSAQPGIVLHQHAMAVGGQLAHRRRHQADAVFVILDLLGDADQHRPAPP